MRMGRRETKPATIIRVIAASSRSGSTVFPSFCGVLHAPPKLLRMVPADSTRELSDLCENCEHLQDGRVEEACFAETFSYIWIIRCTGKEMEKMIPSTSSIIIRRKILQFQREDLAVRTDEIF